MTVAPAGVSSQSALLAAATGERAMKARGFSSNGVKEGATDSGDWTASPEERELRRQEREAEREADKAVQRAMRVREDAERARLGGKHSASAPLSSLAAFSSSLPSSSASPTSSDPSLLSLHQRSLQTAAAAKPPSTATDRVGPIFWDREKEMGMRRQKTSEQIAAEMRRATQLSDRFASSSS